MGRESEIKVSRLGLRVLSNLFLLQLLPVSLVTCGSHFQGPQPLCRWAENPAS